MSTKTQKAIAVVKLAEPVELIERPIPKPGAGEVLVKVSIAGLNPHDNLVRQIAYFVGKENLPGVLAIDIVGEIVELGPNVTTFKVGDQVMGQGDPVVSDTKGSQEYAVLDADFIAPLPTSISPDQASTIILNVLTSYLAVLTPAGLDIPSPLVEGAGKGFDYKNTSIVIVGGNSACGRFAIQLAKWAGLGTIITTAGKAGEAELKAMGATHVIDRHLPEEEVFRKVRDIVGDELLYVLDCNNRVDHTPSVRLLSDRQKGTFVALAGGFLNNTIDESRLGGKQYTVRKFVCRPVLFRDIATAFYKALPKLIADGVLKPTSFGVIEGLDAGKINEALDAYRDGKPSRLNIHVK